MKCLTCGKEAHSRLCRNCDTWEHYAEAYNETKDDFLDEVEEEEAE